MLLTISEPKEDWSKVTEIVSPGNLADLGISRYDFLALCLGNDIFDKYQVRYIDIFS